MLPPCEVSGQSVRREVGRLMQPPSRDGSEAHWSEVKNPDLRPLGGLKAQLISPPLEETLHYDSHSHVGCNSFSFEQEEALPIQLR